MKLFEKKNIISIDGDDLKDAKLSSIDFADENTRKRVFLNILGARLAMKNLFGKKIQANNLYSLYTIHNVIEELDIADIYFEGIKIDVRLVFNREEIFIPKSHFKYDLLPDIYLVLELKEDLSSAEFIGFFEPKILNQQNANEDFYFHEADRLQNPSNIKTFLEEFVVENRIDASEDNIKNAKELFLSLVDKEISKNDKYFLFEQLAKNFSLRETIVELENFEIISKEVVKNEYLLKDSVLDIVGTQKLFDEPSNDDEVEFSLVELDGELVEVDKEFETDDANLLAAEIIAGGAIIDGVANLAAAGLELETALAENTLNVLTSSAELGAELGAELIKEGSEIFADNIQPEIQENEEHNDFEALTEQNGELNELPELKIIENSEENYLNDIENQEQESDENEEVFSLDNFDFNILNETDEIAQEESTENLVSLDSTQLLNERLDEKGEVITEKEGDFLEKVRQLEQEEMNEEDQMDKASTQENSDEFLSQVDDLLQDIEFSDEQKALLENAFLDDIEAVESNLPENSEPNDSKNLIQEQELKSETNDDDVLKVLFEKEKNSEIAELDSAENTPAIQTPKNKRMVIAASVASVVLVSLIAGTTLFHDNNVASPSKDMPNVPISAEGQFSNVSPQENIVNPDLSQQTPTQTADLKPQQEIPGENQQANTSRDMGKAVSDAFLSEPVSASISKVAWEVPEDLAYNDSFRQYLQIGGKNIKLNLQNDLLLATEMAYSNKIIVDLKIKKDGSLQSEDITASSGSKEIDKIVLQSVKNTLMYLKMPSSELSGDSATITLIINF